MSLSTLKHNKAKLLDKPDFSELEDFCTVAVFAKRRAGKTTFLKYMCQFFKEKRFVVLTGNKDTAAEWAEIVHPLYIQRKNLIYRLKRIKKYQSPYVALYRKRKEPLPLRYHLTVVIDDKGSDRTFMNHPVVTDFCSNGRHYGCKILMGLQHFNQLNSENRDQLDYIGMLHTKNKKNIEKVHDEYGTFVVMKLFRELLTGATLNRGMFWIDNTQCSDDIKDCLKKVRLPMPLNLTKKQAKECLDKIVNVPLGNHNVWEYGKKHYLEAESEDDEEESEEEHKNQTRTINSSDEDYSSSDEDDELEAYRYERKVSSTPHPWCNNVSYLDHLVPSGKQKRD